MIVLDTNVLSELMKPTSSENVRNWFARQTETNLFTTAINQSEILYGIAALPEGKRREGLQQTAREMFAEDYAGRILPFDSEAAIAFAAIASERKRLGRPISEADARIAAICYAREAAIATRNVADFENCGISIVNPWQESPDI